jgi:uncharacterized membrane protein (DUF4010 family)
LELFIACLLGLVVGYIAESKGRSFFKWWLYGTLLFIVAIVHVLCISKMVKCPKCAELIKVEATICKHCKSEV